MSEPTTPPVPPVPAAPAAPQYGEFAPVEAPGAAPVAPVAPAASAASAAPVSEQPAYTPSFTPPGYPAAAQQPAYGDPGYGQQQAPAYAQGAGAPVYGQTGFNNPLPPRRRTWDVVLTIILLVLGALGAIGGVIYGILFSSEELVDQAFREQGLGGFSGEVGATPAVLIGSHVLLYLLAIGLSILLLVKRKIAFYVPLAAGVLAAIIFWVAIIALMMTDPNLLDQATRP